MCVAKQDLRSFTACCFARFSFRDWGYSRFRSDRRGSFHLDLEARKLSFFVRFVEKLVFLPVEED